MKDARPYPFSDRRMWDRIKCGSFSADAGTHRCSRILQRLCYAGRMSKDGTQTRDGRSVKAAAVTSTRIELGRHPTWAERNAECLHHVEEFMGFPGSVPVARIITSLHRLNHRMACTSRDHRRDGYIDDLAPMVLVLDALIDDVISVVANAGEHHWDSDHAITMIGSELMKPAHPGGNLERTGAPFPWTEEDAYKAAMAVPKATDIDYDMLSYAVTSAMADTSMEMQEQMITGDVPAVFPVAISKGFDPSPLKAGRIYNDQSNAVDTNALVAMLLRLRGDWRQGIYDFAADGGDCGRLLGYLQVNPATYGADWVLAIIDHINDHDLDRAGILHNPKIMGTLISEHDRNRVEHSWILSDTGMHPRYYDVEPICEMTRRHDAIISGLAVHPGCGSDPAALEIMFRILDSMSMDVEKKLADDVRAADGHEAESPLVDAVRDMTDGMPMSYVAETLASRMSIAASDGR